MKTRNLQAELTELKTSAQTNDSPVLRERIADVEAIIEADGQTDVIVAERELSAVGIEMKDGVPIMATTTDLSSAAMAREYAQLGKLPSGPNAPEHGWMSWVILQISNRKDQLAHLTIQKLSKKGSK